MSTEIAYPLEEAMKVALIEARGDIFYAAQLLRITALRLDRAIRVSATLQATLATLRETPQREQPALTDSMIQSEVDRRIALGRAVGLEALHDLASMPIDENSAQNQVKLAAAARLAGGLEGGGSNAEMAETLRQLQQDYQQNAPRLRVIRERTTVEIEPRVENIVSEQPKQE